MFCPADLSIEGAAEQAWTGCSADELQEAFGHAGRTILVGPQEEKTQLLFQYALNASKHGRDVLYISPDRNQLEQSLQKQMRSSQVTADIFRRIQVKYIPPEASVLQAFFTSLQTNGLEGTQLIVVDNFGSYCPLPQAQSEASDIAKTCAILCNGADSLTGAEVVVGDNLLDANTPLPLDGIHSRLQIYMRSFPLALQVLDENNCLKMSLHRQSSYASTMKIEMLFKAKENGSLHAISEAEATSGDRTSVEHALHVVPEYYNLLASGKKSVEGRLNMGDEAHVCVGDILVMNGTLRLHVKRIALYGSIQEYLVTEGLDVCLPDKDTIDEGVQVYYRFYTPEQEAEFGVLAFEVTVL